MSTHTLDTIGRKIDALIDVLLGRPVKLKTPTNEELAEIVKRWEIAAPGAMVDIPDGMGWPPIDIHPRTREQERKLTDEIDTLTAEEIECVGIDQYAIEIEMAGRRVRYEAPSVEGVHALMCVHDDYRIGKVNPYCFADRRCGKTTGTLRN